MALHSSLTTTNSHEPKGVEAAGAGEVYLADGAGSGAWVVEPAQVYGGICSKDSAIAIGSIGTTPVLFSGFDADMTTNGVTVAHASDSITVVTAGDYFLSASFTIHTAAVGDAGLYQFHLRINAAESSNFSTRREMSGSSDTGAVSFMGTQTFAAADVITIYVESDDGGGGDDIVVDDAQFSIVLLKAS